MKWPPALLRDLASRRAVLFFGAGVSKNSVGADGISRPKGWADFLRVGAKSLGHANKKIVKEVVALIDRNDLLTACEVIKNELGRQRFVDLMKAEFQEPGFRPASIHTHLWRLDLRITITPNVDHVYDSLVAERGSGTVSVKNYNDDDIGEAIRRHEPLLIKSHGSVAAPNSLIFTRSEYASARNQHRNFYEILYSLLSTNTFLFVGCGLEDPDIRYLLEDYRYRNVYGPKHYFTLAEGSYSDKITSVFSESLNLDFIEYDPKNNHAALTAGLEELVRKVDLKRQEFGRTLTW